MIHYNASVSCERIVETKHQSQDTIKHISIKDNLQQYPKHS